MNAFCGFDLDKVPALKRALAQVPGTANRQSLAVGTTVDTAMSAIARGNGLSPKQLGIDEGSLSTDADRSGFSAPITDAAGIAADIGRRLTHLLACQKLQLDGYTVDPARVFDDEPAPNEQTIKNTLAQARKTLAEDSPWDRARDLGDLTNQLGGLTPAEAEAVVGNLSDSELRELNNSYTALGALSSFGGPSFGTDVRVRLSNALMPGLSADQLRRMSAQMPFLQPPLGGTDESGHDDLHGLHYQWVDGQPFLVDAKGRKVATPSEIQQGDLGDCWFLAGLGAEQRADPNFAQKHIRDNGNGTYTVTLFKDGKPYPVTVDGQLPYNDWNPPQSSFEHSPSGAMWVQIYEKAYAQYNGGYANIEGGFGDRSMRDLTGNDTHKVDRDDTSLTDIANKLNSGVPVTVGTVKHRHGFLWLDQDGEYVDNGKIVTDHEYIVTGVDNNADPPTISLRNPWGQGAAAPETITITQDEFNDHFGSVSFGD